MKRFKKGGSDAQEAEHSKETLTERVLNRFKNIKIVAGVIVGASLIGWLGTLTDAILKLRSALPSRATIATYDLRTEESAFQVARLVDDFFLRIIGSPENKAWYDLFRDDYRRIEAEMLQLQLRNNVRPLNSLSTSQVEDMIEMWKEIEQLHKKEGVLSPSFAKSKLEDCRAILSVIVAFEESKPKEKSQ